ncbi:MAG: aldo/keto reductase [Trueperaceae bacterium]
MEYRSLGRTGVKVSELCLGAMNFGDRTGPEEAQAIMDRALAAGINFVDTANMYSRGRSEEIVGEALKQSGQRDRVVLATKVYNPMSEDVNDRGNSRRHIIQQCEASLKRLQTDYIDLYQIHRPQSDIPIDETLRALDDLVRAGMVRYIGTSTFAAWQLVEALWASRELNLNRFVSEQPPYNLVDRRIERELLPMAQTYGLGLIVWSPLAMGLLTGKYDFREVPAGDTRFGQQKARVNPVQQARWTEGAFEVVSVLKAIASEKGCTPAQLALAWCVRKPGITSAIIGPRTTDQLEDNLAALNVEITEDDHRRLDQAAEPGGSVSPFYQADFGPHPHRI